MTFRLLTREEAATVPGMISPMPESLFVIGTSDEEGVVAACGVFFVIHADPIWIRPDKRNHGKVLLHLWEATKQEINRRRYGPEVFVGMTETNPGQPTEGLVERMILTAGGEEFRGRLFTVPTGQA